MMDALATTLRFTTGLQHFLGSTLSAEECRQMVRDRLRRRQESFLYVVDQAVLRNPRSPYLPLFRQAGVSYDDLARWVEGDGVEGALSRLFDAGVSVALDEFKGRVRLNRAGNAVVDVPLNDALTSFRIVAVAQGGAGLFGTGSASIQTTQDLMVLSGLPPLVREGDRFKGEFTIRNTTNRRMSLDVAAKVDGISGALPPVALVLQPGEAQEVGWEVSVPIGVEKLGWAVEVKEKGAPAMDRIKVQQRVVPATPISTFQATIVQITKDYRLFVERPQDALANRGGVRVTLRPRISEGLSGVVDYMKSYPYTCMEQKISIAVALRNERLWKRWIALSSRLGRPSQVLSDVPVRISNSHLLHHRYRQ